MSEETKPSVTLKPRDLQKVLDALSAANAVLKPYLVSFTSCEQQALPGVSDSTLPFLKGSLVYEKTNRGVVPVYININELKTNLKSMGLPGSCLQIRTTIIF
jgi:hypothetical protein